MAGTIQRLRVSDGDVLGKCGEGLSQGRWGDERSRTKICIVSHQAFGALSGGTRGHVGGVEWQTSLLAKWLAGRDYRVSLVTWDEGQPPGLEVEGVRVYKLCRRDEGIPGLRFFYPRWTSLNDA